MIDKRIVETIGFDADDTQRGGLAAAGRAEQCEEFMIVDVKIDSV